MARKAPLDTRTRRRKRGFEAAASLLAPTVQAVGAQRGFAVSRLLTHWPEVVGADIASRCRPVRISHGRGGIGATLTLLTSGPHAPMLSMVLPSVREKVNACCGWNVVSRVVLTQTAADGFTPPMPPPSRPRPSPADLALADAIAEGAADNDLAAALRRLALNFQTCPTSNRKV